MAHEIEKVSWRKRAKPRIAPYWKLYTEGRYIGWRKFSAASPDGQWLARTWHAEQKKYSQKPLGDFADRPDEERYRAALAEAVKWFEHLGMGGTTKSITVKSACEAYIEKLKAEKSEAAADDAKWRFQRLIYDDPIAKVPLEKLAPRHLVEWKGRAMKDRERISFDREASSFRAALNLALRRREVVSNHAWAEELKPLVKNGDKQRRRLYLDRAARTKLIEKAAREVRPFLTTLCLLPLRPGDPAKLLVEHLDTKHGVLHVPTGKTVSREVPLPPAALEHFKACAKDKLPTAWLVSRADRSQWIKPRWNEAIKEAAKKAKLPKATCAYSLRHSVITDLVKGGLDIFHVAKLAGTSVVMIEQHYGHLQREHARSALEKLAL